MKKTITIGSFIAICLMCTSILTFGAPAKEKQDNNRFDYAYIYETNENGQTYGSAMYASSPDKEPDLILAEGLDGTEGYIYATDLNADLPNSPEELLASMMRNQEIWDNAPIGQVVIARTISLYDIDGKTVIGEFPITIGIKDSENAEISNLLLKLD